MAVDISDLTRDERARVADLTAALICAGVSAGRIAPTTASMHAAIPDATQDAADLLQAITRHMLHAHPVQLTALAPL